MWDPGAPGLACCSPARRNIRCNPQSFPFSPASWASLNSYSRTYTQVAYHLRRPLLTVGFPLRYPFAFRPYTPTPFTDSNRIHPCSVPGCRLAPADAWCSCGGTRFFFFSFAVGAPKIETGGGGVQKTGRLIGGGAVQQGGFQARMRRCCCDSVKQRAFCTHVFRYRRCTACRA